MSGRRNIVLAVLLLMVFIFGIGSSLVACADDHHTPGTDADQHCMIHCTCHSAALLPTAERAPASVLPNEHIALDEPLKLPLVPASIFNPPRA